MRHTLFAILAVLFSAWHAQCQIVADTFYIPNYPIPEIYYTDEAPELPDNVWNHKLKYFPPWFYDQYELPNCGQSSGVYNCLSYEFNRLFDRAADSTNIFSPTYSYNMLCEGNGWYGVSAFDSWNLIKSQGNPTISDFDEFAEFESSNGEKDYRGQHWMQGYENYLAAFKNRISGYYSLNVSTDEDLKILMHYFDDHLDGGETGGTAIFYSNAYFMHTGTEPTVIDSVLCFPNEKTKVISYISGQPTHSMTIVGYYKNTTIDFNGDGMITDSIDINGDHILNRHDNEKILWIIINSYGDYWPYSMFLFKYGLTDKFWNKQVFIPVPDTAYTPELTFKLKLKHACRNSIKISAGISSDPESEYPEKVIDFPIFNFQGAQHNMTGLDSLQNSDILEFGIDVSDLKKQVSLTGDSKIFLRIENAGGLDGELQYFSIIQYKNGIADEQKIVSEPTTIYAATVSNFSGGQFLYSQAEDDILQLDAPKFLATNQGDEIESSLSGYGGKSPYSYLQVVSNEYSQEYLNESYSQTEGLVFSIDTLTAIGAGWQIPFAGTLWDSIYVGSNATISFTGRNKPPLKSYPYPPIHSSYYDDLQIDIFSGFYFQEKVAYAIETSDTCITVWFDDVANTGAKFSANIYRDGRIKMSYSGVEDYYLRSAGLKTYCNSYFSGLCSPGVSLHKNTVVFHPLNVSRDILISENGEFMVPATNTEGTRDIYFMLSDANLDNSIMRTRIEVLGAEVSGQIFPNPFKENAYLEYKSLDYSQLEISIYNISGQIVANFTEELLPGTNIIKISSQEQNLKSGIYTCVLKTEQLSKNLRMVAL